MSIFFYFEVNKLFFLIQEIFLQKYIKMLFSEVQNKAILKTYADQDIKGGVESIKVCYYTYITYSSYNPNS